MRIIKMLIIGISIITISLITGCLKKQVAYKKEDVIAVWKHEVGVYSVSVQHNTQIIDVGFDRFLTNGSYQVVPIRDISLFADVPEESKNYESTNMWYEATYYYDAVWGYSCIASVHVHSIKDINDGGWNHGKFGSGRLERVD